jgi:DNA-binding transcriptional LysR family regulator
MDRLTAINVFIEVSKTESFTKAADNLNMSRPMVTRYISLLEDWVGLALLQRSTRNVSLTPSGEAYLDKCKHIQDIAFDMEMGAKASKGQPRVVVRVASSVGFATTQFNNLVAPFLEKYPQVSMELIVTDRPVNLIESKIDFAIRITNNLQAGTVSKQLGICQSVLVATPTYLMKNGTPKKLSDLDAHNVIAHEHFRNKRLLLQRGKEHQEILFKSRFSSNETMVLLEATLSHLGIAMLPRYLVTEQIASKSLLEVLPEWQLPELGLHIIFMNKKFVSPQVRLFIDFLSEKIKKQIM